MFRRPDPGVVKQHLCGDKGYDVWALREHLWSLNYELHIANKGVVFTPQPSEFEQARVPRRWVVERSFSWLNGFRALRIRWSRLERTFRAELSLGCAVIAFRAAGVLG